MRENPTVAPSGVDSGGVVPPLLALLDDDARADVTAAGEVVTVPPGTAIVEEGDTGRDLCVLLSGRATVDVRDEHGGLVEVGMILAGQTFGELAALLGEPRSATVVAADTCEVLRIAPPVLRELLERHPRLGVALTRSLARDLSEARGQRNRLAGSTAPERVEIDAEALANRRGYLGRFYLDTVRNSLKRQRLLVAERYPTYASPFVVTTAEVEQWATLFGPAAVPVPWTTHADAWTLLLLELLEDLGINYRNLRHRRTRLTLPSDDPGLPVDAPLDLEIDVIGMGTSSARTGLVTTRSRVRDADGEVRLTQLDTYEVSGLDKGTVRRIDRLDLGKGVQEVLRGMAPDALPEPEELPAAEGVGLLLAEDLGLRYGRLSGNRHPVHTSTSGARALGLPGPYLQHLCVTNLLLHHLTQMTGQPPTRLDLDFTRRVYVDQHVEIRLDGDRVVLLDDEGQVLTHGLVTIAGQAPSRPTVGDPAADDQPTAAETPAEAEPTELAAAIAAVLAPDHPEVRARTWALLADIDPHAHRGLDTGEYRDLVLGWLQEVADAGLCLLPYPGSVGGQDDPAAAIAVFETLAHGDLSLLVKYGVQVGLFGGAVQHLGTARHHEAHLADVGTLRLPGCFALTETGHGSDARAIRTTATYDPRTEEFVISTPDDDARKDYIGNAARHGRVAAVFAQLHVDGEDRGVHAFVVPVRHEDGTPMPGVRIADCGEKLGLRGVDNGRLWFDDVRVPREALLDRHGQVSVDGRYSSPIASDGARFFTMLSALVLGRVSVGLAGLSASKVALAVAIRYALTRRQFADDSGTETLLLDYPTHQRRLMVPLARTIGLNLALQQVVAQLAEIFSGAPTDDATQMAFEADAAGLKAAATWHATATIQECREACGGAGYLAANRFADLKADTDVFTTFEGDNTVLAQLVTRGLLSEFKSQFADMDLSDTVRWVIGRVASAVIPTPPSRSTDTAHLRSAGFHQQALDARVDALVEGLGLSLKRAVDRGQTPGAAFLERQDQVVAAGMAHVDALVVRRFTEAVARITDPAVAALLTDVRDLCALSILEQHKSWYLEQGMFTAGKTRAISAQVTGLCAALREHAEVLVDGFAIPDDVLDAPIATDGVTP